MKKLNHGIITSGLTIFLILGMVFVYKYMEISTQKKRILLFMNLPPFSSDPLHYDAFIHHVAFRASFASLISQYKIGEHTPEIAKSWTVNTNFTEWTFKIRDNLTFSDGTPITAKSVFTSWLRMAKLMKRRGSSSGFFENLLGYDKLDSSSTNIDGLTISDSTITILLKKPMPKLLDKISFGLYAIVHPSQFDNKTNEWTAGKENLISSGPYKIQEWNEKLLLLKLRNDYPEDLHHKKPIEEIEIFWNRDLHTDNEIDLTMGSELTTAPQKDFLLQGSPPSYMYFMRLLNWRNPKSFFYKKENRKLFRNEFYKNLDKLDVKAIRSFFPLIIKGIKELIDPQNLKSENKKSLSITIPVYPPTAFAKKETDATLNAVVTATKELNLIPDMKAISLNAMIEQVRSESIETTWDLCRFNTGILASDPFDDVRFMFKSKEGILLPDETGEILRELEKETVDLQKINELLWDQGLIWPVTHYSSGLWARPDLDFSEINLVLPPTSFQWIGWKN